MTTEQRSEIFPDAAVNLDSILKRLMNIGKPGTGITSTITEEELINLNLLVGIKLKNEPMMLELTAPVYVTGDIHGQFSDLIRLFSIVGWPPKVNYLFLGDYIDRGNWSIETISLLFAIKLKYPLNFLLLRGNHETPTVNRIYGFYEDIVRRFSNPRLFMVYQDVFSMMPLTALVSERILCMHGGLSPILLNNDISILKQIIRPIVDPPNPSLAIDLLWSDPDAHVQGFKTNIRGVSCTFGPDCVATVCEKNKLDLIVRAHQVVQDGYEFFANQKLVTIFSAPHYCGQFDNAAAILGISKELVCSFQILRPQFPERAKTTSEPTQLTVYKKL